MDHNVETTNIRCPIGVLLVVNCKAQNESLKKR